MERETIESMKAQMRPGAQARAALEERLAQAGETRPAAWKRYAAAAACAALVLAAWPVYRLAVRPTPQPHGYEIVERQGELSAARKAPAVPGAQDGASPAPSAPTDDPPEALGPREEGRSAAVIQYDALAGHLVGPYGRMQPPDWYGGHVITDEAAGERLTVFLVEDSRTPELEEQVREWCGGGEVSFDSVRYSWNELAALMERVSDALDGDGIWVPSSCGFDEGGNCLLLDFLAPVSGEEREALLLLLAELDPDGDAIRVRMFEEMGPVDPEIVK